MCSMVLHVRVAVVLCFALFCDKSGTGSVGSAAVHEAAPEAVRAAGRRLLTVRSAAVTRSVYVLEGTNVTLSCVVPDVNNSTKVKWLGPNLNSLLAINRQSFRRRFSVTGNETEGEFNLRVSMVERSDDGKYYCREGQPANLYTSTRLKVLTEAETPVIDGYQWPAVEGDRVTLSCSCHGGLPQPALSWTLASVPQKAHHISHSHHKLKITMELHVGRQHNGAVLSCTADQGHHALIQPKTTSLVIDVLYPPYVTVSVHPQEVNEGDDVTLICIVDSNPPATITWRRQMFGREVAMATVGTTTIVLPNVTKQDNGSYTCYAKNTVGAGSDGGIVQVKERESSGVPVEASSKSNIHENATEVWQQGQSREETWEERLKLILGLVFASGLIVAAACVLGRRFRKVSKRKQPAFELVPVNVNGAHYNRRRDDAVESTQTEDEHPTAVTPQPEDQQTSVEEETEGEVVDEEERERQEEDGIDDGDSQENIAEQARNFEDSGDRNLDAHDQHRDEGVQIMDETRPRPPSALCHIYTAFSRDQLTFIKALGQGEFGNVYLAKIEGINATRKEQLVAVKTVKVDASHQACEDMRRELRMMMKITAVHPNVVSLLGYCTQSESLMLILEYVRNGDLLTFLRKDRATRDVTYNNLHGESKTLRNKDLISFAWQVAKGMAFLASKQCIHRDLAARNILVGENKTCKISDFGLARDGPEYKKLTQSRLPLRWMAPETLRDRLYSTRSDVWSFGIVLYEIATLGSIPYPTMCNERVAAIVQSGHLMPKPAHCTDQLYFLMEKCWEFYPDDRPYFSELSSALCRMLRDEQEHISLTRLEEHVYANMETSPEGAISQGSN